MDQLICASLSHAHCWYEVGMLKVPADIEVPWNITGHRVAIIATNNAISQTRPQRCRIQQRTSSQSRLLRRPSQPQSLRRVCFRYSSRPHAGGQVVQIQSQCSSAAATAAMTVAVISAFLGTSRPQRQVLYGTSKGVNSSVGLCFFCGHLEK